MFFSNLWVSIAPIHVSVAFRKKILNLKVTSYWLNRGLSNQKWCYIQMHLDIEKSGEKDREQSKEWLVNVDPELVLMSNLEYF